MNSYIKTFIKYKYMLELFVRKDIEKKYKDAYLGVLWSLLNPLLNMVVLAIIFSTLFKRDIENFPLYLITGRIIYDFFSGTTNAAMRSVTGSAALLKKINFPKYMVVLSTVLSNFIIFIISFVDLFLIMFLTNAPITWAFLVLPVYLLVYMLFVMGCSLVISILNAYFRDTQHLYGVVLMIVSYFSAIFYPADIIPEQFRFLLYFNPIYQFIEAFRAITYYGTLPTMTNTLVCIGYAILSLVIGTLVFFKYKDKIIERI